MKFVLTTIVAICVGAVSADLTKLGVEGQVDQIEFDSDSNVYVVAHADEVTSVLYKLDETRNVTSEHSFGRNTEIFVTKSNNIYVFDTNSEENPKESLFLLKANSEDISKIYETPLNNPNSVHFKDEADNIFFNTLFGVALLRPDETVPTAIVNLEYFNIIDKTTFAIDSYGNFYFGGSNTRTREEVFAIMQKYQTGETAPYAEVSASPSPNLNGVVADFEGNIYVSFVGDQARIYGAYTYGLEDVEFAQYLHFFKSFHPTENRLYFLSVNLYDYVTCHFYFLHKEDIFSPLEVVQIPQNLSSEMCNLGLQIQIVSDSKGNLFFISGKEVLYVLNNETEIKSITFPNGSDLDVSAIAIDQNDDLWIVKGSLYVVRNGSTVAENLTNAFTLGSSAILKISEKTNELFIGVAEGLFLYTSSVK